MSENTKNSEDAKKEELTQEVHKIMEHFKKGGALTPADSAHEWEQMIEASDRTPQQKEQLKELGRFLSLKKYFDDRNEKLEPVIVDAFCEIHKFPLSMQIDWLRDINQKLMESISDVSARAQFRN
jgi:hypothetical protein